MEHPAPEHTRLETDPSTRCAVVLKDMQDRVVENTGFQDTNQMDHIYGAYARVYHGQGTERSCCRASGTEDDAGQQYELQNAAF